MNIENIRIGDAVWFIQIESTYEINPTVVGSEYVFSDRAAALRKADEEIDRSLRESKGNKILKGKVVRIAGDDIFIET